MRNFLFLLLMLSLSGCAGMSSPLKDQFHVDDAKVIRDSFTIRDKTIPLPPGDWKIMASGFNAEKFFQVYLMQEHSEKLFSYILISVDSQELARENGYKPSEEVNRKDMHHTVIVNNAGGEAQDWWFVNNRIVSFTPKDTYPAMNDAAAYIKSHNYKITDDMLSVEHFLSGKHPYKKRHLAVRYMYNPEAAGFPTSPKAEWKTSDWNAMRVNVDPKKVEYINDLIKQHTLIHKQIKAGFHPDKQPVSISTNQAKNPIKKVPDTIKHEWVMNGVRS